MPLDYAPILILMVFAVLVPAGITAVSSWIGPRLPSARKLETYESGMPLLDASRKRMSVQFFVIAMIFILFDVEVAFVYPWALVYKTGGAGLFAEMLVFLAVLAVGYAYIWKKGAFDW
jgi:NADH-quinone oxidoreductase subunit A